MAYEKRVNEVNRVLNEMAAKMPQTLDNGKTIPNRQVESFRSRINLISEKMHTNKPVEGKLATLEKGIQMFIRLQSEKLRGLTLNADINVSTPSAKKPLPATPIRESQNKNPEVQPEQRGRANAQSKLANWTQTVKNRPPSITQTPAKEDPPKLGRQ